MCESFEGSADSLEALRCAFHILPLDIGLDFGMDSYFCVKAGA